MVPRGQNLPHVHVEASSRRGCTISYSMNMKLFFINVEVQCSFEESECRGPSRPPICTSATSASLGERGPPHGETRERPLLPPKLFSPPPLFARSFLRGDFSLHLSLSLGSKWSAKREGGGERRRDGGLTDRMTANVSCFCCCQ